MQKWEYLTIRGYDLYLQDGKKGKGISAWTEEGQRDELAKKLNELGKEGWEVCGSYLGVLVLKKPIE